MTAADMMAAQASAPSNSMPDVKRAVELLIDIRKNIEHTANRVSVIQIHDLLDPELILKYSNLYDPFSLLAALQLEFVQLQQCILSKVFVMEMARGV